MVQHGNTYNMNKENKIIKAVAKQFKGMTLEQVKLIRASLTLPLTYKRLLNRVENAI